MIHPQRTFQGFRSPNSTPVPDELFDELLSDLTGAELKVVLYIMRRTFGFKKSSDDISLRQICRGITTRDGRVLDRGTGLSLSSAQSAIKSLLAKGIIAVTRNRSKERGDQASTYRLHVVGAAQELPVAGAAPAPEFRYGGLPLIGTGGTRISVPQETVQQERDGNLRTSRMSHTDGDQGQGEHADAARTRAFVPSSPLASFPSVPARPTVPTVPAVPTVPTVPTVPKVPRVPARTGGLHTLSDVLAHHVIRSATPMTPSQGSGTARPRGRMRPTPQIGLAVTEISQEFGDLAHRTANSTQAMRLWEASGWSESAFASLLYEVRSVTRQQPHVVKRMPYFWSVVRDRLGAQTSAE